VGEGVEWTGRGRREEIRALRSVSSVAQSAELAARACVRAQPPRSARVEGARLSPGGQLTGGRAAAGPGAQWSTPGTVASFLQSTPSPAKAQPPLLLPAVEYAWDRYRFLRIVRCSSMPLSQTRGGGSGGEGRRPKGWDGDGARARGRQRAVPPAPRWVILEYAGFETCEKELRGRGCGRAKTIRRRPTPEAINRSLPDGLSVHVRVRARACACDCACACARVRVPARACVSVRACVFLLRACLLAARPNPLSPGLAPPALCSVRPTRAPVDRRGTIKPAQGELDPIAPSPQRLSFDTARV
jgi:hypothetical protein